MLPPGLCNRLVAFFGPVNSEGKAGQLYKMCCKPVIKTSPYKTLKLCCKIDLSLSLHSSFNL